MNNITIVGNLGSDPEGRYTPNGNFVCNFSVADNSRRKDSGGTVVQDTQWFRVSVWGQQGEACENWLQKGALVCVIGRLSHRLYETKSYEVDVSLDVNASTVHFLSGTRLASGDEEDEDDEKPAKKPAKKPARKK